MIDAARFRRIALGFPLAEEQDHRGHPSFRVRDKIFATLWPEENRAVLKLAMDDQQDLVATHPAAFSLNAWSKQGWTNVHLDHVSEKECRELLQAAWKLVAPKKAIRDHDAAE